MTDKTSDIQDFLEKLLSDGKTLLDPKSQERQQLNRRGKDLYKQGEDFLADKLNVGNDDASRKELRKNAGIAAGAGALALLLSSRSKRKFAAMAGLGTLGVIAFKAHQAGRIPQDMDDVIGLLKGDKADKRANILLKAMVAAAQADGEISADELTLINTQKDVSAEDVRILLETSPDVEEIAALAEDDQTAFEIYAVSCRVANGLHPKERNYLDRLAMALRLDPEMAAQVETEVRTG